MRTKVLETIGLLVALFIIEPGSAQAAFFSPKGSDCVRDIEVKEGCSPADAGGSVKLKRTDNSAIKGCDDVRYKSECSSHDKVIGTKELYSPSKNCEGPVISTYAWEVKSCS